VQVSVLCRESHVETQQCQAPQAQYNDIKAAVSDAKHDAVAIASEQRALHEELEAAEASVRQVQRERERERELEIFKSQTLSHLWSLEHSMAALSPHGSQRVSDIDASF